MDHGTSTARQCLFSGMRGKEQSRLSLGSYGRPRMTEKLKEIGLNVGHRRVGRFRLGDVNITCQAVDAPKRHISRQIPLTDNTCLHV